MESGKYNFYYDFANRKVVCTTYYKSQLIKGIAKCDPEDDFDIDIGKKLAYLRCKKKLLTKKSNRAAKVCANAYIAATEARVAFERATEFVEDVSTELAEVQNDLINLAITLDSTSLNKHKEVQERISGKAI